MPNPDRRQFLGHLGISAVGASLLSDISPTEAADPAPSKDKLPDVVDTHTHFYDPTRPQGVPWPGKDDPVLYKKMLPETFKKLTQKHNVVGTVIVEASPLVEDNQWLLDLAKDDPFILGIVGNLAPGTPDFAKNLKRFAKNPLFRGIRINNQDWRKGSTKPEYIADLKLLAEHDLELDINGGPDTPAEAAKIADKLPDLRILINHAGNLRIDGKAVPEDWFKGMQEAAKKPKVWCKVSALVESTGRSKGDAPQDPKFYRPVLEALWKVWGEDRMIYGSDWPVSERFATYATLFHVVEDFFSQHGKQAMAKFFSLNALAAYKWPKR